MSLSSAQKKSFRSIGHHLDPVVQVSENGLSEGALNELERALFDHELIKIKLMSNDREERAAQIATACAHGRAQLVQQIGKMALLYRRNPKASPKLSNLRRHSGE